MNNEEDGLDFPSVNVGTRLSGQLLRLDLYRLISYFQASEMLANLSNGDDFLPVAIASR
jgi:hypothetical protein